MGRIFYGRSSAQGQHLRSLKSPEKLRVVKSNRRTNSLAFSQTPRERKSYNLPFLARATRSEKIRNHHNYCRIQACFTQPVLFNL
ncbi:hypothetical protein CDAR_321081 [Caerostris darwini]|uniref:Ribosomal protein S4 n=1 Tax=Caerostris darwini TaxID=1538125 RepID=A0AAV4X0J2_9ARAC|nr:hypothetical protein CDAR_321081 [Caerostris darwini]